MRTGSQKLESFVAALTATFRKFCDEHDLRVLTTATDKYGSLVWEAGSEFQSLARYLTLAFTQGEYGQREHTPAVLEVWVAADNGTRYTRKCVEQLPFPESDTKLDGLAKQLLRRGWEAVLELSEQDLSESYLVPRS